MSRKAREHLHAQEECDAWGAVETHIKAAGSAREAKLAARWNSTVAPATQSNDSAAGSYGGAWIATKTHLNTTRMNDDTCASGYDLRSGHGIAGRSVHSRNSDVAVFCAYARNGDIHTKLAHISALTRCGQLPFILMMDANRLVEETKEMVDRLRLRAELVIPEGC